MTRDRLGALIAIFVFAACDGGSSSDAGAGGPRDGGRVPGPPSGDCGSVRLTSYAAGRAGWCELPRDLPMLPDFVRQGLTAAIAEPWNTSSYEGEPGESCGECWEIDTVTDTRIVMITDLCPIEGNSLCAGAHFHLDLANEAAAVLGGGALDEASARRVACPVEGNVHVLVNDENVSYLRFQLVNHRVPVRGVDVRGAGPGVGAPNDWIPARRSGGAWEALGVGGPLENGGTGVELRLTSAQGQVVESTVLVDAHPERGAIFDLGVQLEDRAPSSGGSCDYVPPGDIFVDGFGGIDEVRWQINPWGEAERGFFGETSDGCFAGTCLGIERLGQWSGFHLYYRQPFPTSTFSRVRFRARTDGATTVLSGAPSRDGERCTGASFTIGPEWSEHEVDVTAACAGLGELNAFTLDNTGEQVYLRLDDVRFER